MHTHSTKEQTWRVAFYWLACFVVQCHACFFTCNLMSLHWAGDKKTFMAHDSAITEQMPKLIQSLLPFRLTARFGISNAMYTAMRSYLEIGNSIAGTPP